mgnify:CR=1 FL=1
MELQGVLLDNQKEWSKKLTEREKEFEKKEKEMKKEFEKRKEELKKEVEKSQQKAQKVEDDTKEMLYVFSCFTNKLNRIKPFIVTVDQISLFYRRGFWPIISWKYMFLPCLSQKLLNCFLYLISASNW